ncbi:MAG: putative sulfate exporter family transporter [Faecalispora jeddahensis]
MGRVVWKAFPKFILFFLAAVALNTVLANAAADEVLYTDYFSPFFANGYKFFVTVALAGVGFKIKFKELFTKGLKPIALAALPGSACFSYPLSFPISS